MILDASVIAKWFLDEEGTDVALKIREDYINGKMDIEIPDLLIYEIANVLRYKKFAVEEIKDAISSIFSMDFLIVTPTPSLINLASQIALENNITIYDAVYVALSKYFGASLITADKKLYEKVKEQYEVLSLLDYE